MPNFSSLAGLEVTEKFGVVVVGSKWVLCLTQQSCFYSCFGLSWVELSYIGFWKQYLNTPQGCVNTLLGLWDVLTILIMICSIMNTFLQETNKEWFPLAQGHPAALFPDRSLTMLDSLQTCESTFDKSRQISSTFLEKSSFKKWIEHRWDISSLARSLLNFTC